MIRLLLFECRGYRNSRNCHLLNGFIDDDDEDEEKNGDDRNNDENISGD